VVVGGQLHAPSALPVGKKRLIPIEEEAGWPVAPVWKIWRREKSVTPN
jgi:hypothetical protein